jgi:hypothetical protein
MNDKTKAGITAGLILAGAIVIIGVLGAFARGVGCCNCLLPIGGGILAVYFYSKRTMAAVQPGEGAMMGAIAGAVAGVIYLIIGVPLVYFISAGAVQAQFDQLRQQGINIPAGLSILALSIIFGVIGVVVYTILATIGGLIGTSIFKGTPTGTPPTPPPPAGYGPQPPFGGPGYGGPQPPPPPAEPPSEPPMGGGFGTGS